MISFLQFVEQRSNLILDKSTHEYSCVLYYLPNDISNEIYDWGMKNISNKELYVEEDENYGREKYIHCTVLYGIHDQTSSSSKKIIKNIKPFKIKLGKITAFTTSDKYDVLKIDVKSVKLHNFNKSLKGNLEVTETYPEYKPHITIAYLKKGFSEKYINEDCFEGKTIIVNKVVFSSSNGTKTEIFLKK